MKKIFTLCAALAVTILLTKETKAQYSEDFESDSTALQGQCWQFSQMHWTSNPAYVINGNGSLLSNPPVNPSSTKDVYTPALIVSSTSITISFNYKLSNKITGNATRTIEIGIVDPSNNYTSLDLISLDKDSPLTPQAYSNTFTVTPGDWKVVIKTSGANGDGNTRTILDDFYTDASPKYGASSCNDAPLAVDDAFSGITGNPVFGNVMNNDNDPNGEPMNAAIVLSSLDGTVVLNPDGTFSFTPNAGFNGSTTSFTYRLADNGFAPANSNSATVTINFSDPSALPVHLVNFQGNMNKNNKVSLQWKVSFNETVSSFDIQRSSNGRDFATIGIVLASDKIDVENYAFYETVISSEKVMYRLKMIDRQQRTDYSRILVFQNKISNSNGQVKIYGNPVIDKLTFSFTSSSTQPVNVKVYDISGSMQMNQKVMSYEGNNMISLPLSSTIKPGFYVVEVNDGNLRHTSKFVKH